MDFKLIDFIEHILNIVVLFLLLRVLLFKPVRKFMQQREEKFNAERAAIQADTDAAHTMRQQYEQQMQNARQDAEALAQQRMQRAEEEARALAAHAKRDAQAILEKARKQSLEDRDELMLDLRDQTAALAVDLAGHILSREVSEQDNAVIIQDYFQKVG